MENRFEKRFAELARRNEGGFVPFVTLCDPDKETSKKILDSLVKAGADALELGFPFSDPSADGPVIQLADKRALGSGAKTSDLFDCISYIRQKNPDLPISILVYANIVCAHGLDTFFKMAADSGLDAVLIPDVPVGMLHTSGDFKQAADRHGVNLVLIAPPNASEQTLEQIAKTTGGYTYVLSRFGITGTDKAFGKPVKVIKRLKELGAPVPILGFGISTPEHVKEALKTGAVGAIAGSACVKIVAAHLDDVPLMLSELEKYVASMKAATRA